MNGIAPHRMGVLVVTLLVAQLIFTSSVHGAEPPAPAAPEHARYAWLKKHAFGRCVYCHADRPYLPYFLDYRSTLTVGTPGDPRASRLYQMVASGRMPPGARLSQEKISAIYWWIAGGAEDFLCLSSVRVPWFLCFR